MTTPANQPRRRRRSHSPRRGAAPTSRLERLERLEPRMLLAFAPAAPELPVTTTTTTTGMASYTDVASDAGAGSDFGNVTPGPDATVGPYPIGSDFRVNTITGVSEINGSVVATAADGSFVVGWSSNRQDGTGWDVYARRFSAAGAPMGEEFRVNATTAGTQAWPAVAVDAGGDFVVAWANVPGDGTVSVEAQRFDRSGAPLGGEFRVSTAAASYVSRPSVAAEGDGSFMVTWSNPVPGGASPAIYARRYDAAGQPLGGQFVVADGGGLGPPDVAAAGGGGFVVTWGTADWNIFARRYDAAAAPLGGAFRVNNNSTTVYGMPSPAVAAGAHGEFVVAWQSYGPDGRWVLFARGYDAAGAPRGDEVRVNPPASDTRFSLASVAADADGNFVVTWDGNDAGSDSALYGRRYSAADQPLGEPFRVNTSSVVGFSVDAAADAVGDFVIAWGGGNVAAGAGGTGVYARRFAASGQTEGGEFPVHTTGVAVHSAPSVASDGRGQSVVAWVINGPDGSYTGVYARRYDAAGQPIGGEFLVNQSTFGAQESPAVAMDSGGDFVVAWEGQGNAGSGIYARRYDAAGVPLGGEFLVTTPDYDEKHSPAVAVDGAGDFVVAWVNAIDGGGYYVDARSYDPNGAPLGAEFHVSADESRSADGSRPSVAADGAGDFVVAWSSFGPATGVHARRYDPAGQPLGDEFFVDAGTLPDVAMDAGGDFVIAWHGPQPGSGGSGIPGAVDVSPGVHARRYNAAGVPQGDAIRVDTTDSNAQVAPDVAMDAAGDFLVAWTSFVPYCYDTNGMVCPPYGDIYARRFNAAGVPLGAEFRVNTTPVPNTTPAVAMEADGDFVVVWDNNSPAADGIYARRYGNTPAPRVAGVFVGSVDWKPGFYRYLADHGQGEAVFGYALPKGAGQLGVLPWSFLNQVSIRFSGPVIALQRHLSLAGSGGGGPVVGDFAYDPATNTGIWTFDRPLPAGPLTLRLDAGEGGVTGTGAARLRLDGEWSDAESWVSGDGEPGGDFLFRVNVLPGDATRDGRVNALDLGFVKQRLNRTWEDPGSGNGAYSPFADLDGSGSINASDLGWVKRWLNTRTPAATSAATALLFSTAAVSP